MSAQQYHVSAKNCDSTCYTLGTALQQCVIDASNDKVACTMQACVRADGGYFGTHICRYLL